MKSPGVLLCAALALLGQEPREARVSFGGAELAYFYDGGAPGPVPSPLVVFLHPDMAGGADAARAAWREWQPLVAERGWRLIVPRAGLSAPAWTDAGVKALEAAVRDAWKRLASDAARTYLAGQLDAAPQVFYAVSRLPDMWAAALAIQGNPKAAVDTNRLFGANTSLVPVLWALQPEDRPIVETVRRKLASQNFNVNIKSGAELTAREALDWLAQHRREPFPTKIDCETGSPAFARCYWLEMTRFDPSLRNDVLPSTRVVPGAGAFLDLGGFGFNAAAPGPGVLVGWLPPDYTGPLRLGDRIVSVGGREIRSGLDYIGMMDETREEKTVGIVLLRDGKRQRLETRILLPRREELFTVRIQGEYLTHLKEILVVSRGVAGIRFNVPPHWAPCHINWNGTESGAADKPGCWMLELGSNAVPCPGQ